jgi:hypothetical protein
LQSITYNQRILLGLLGRALFDAAAELPAETDWNAVLREAKQQAVLPLAFHAARERFSEERAAALEARINEIVVNNMTMEYDHVELHQCMEAAGIPYVVMKGSASAAWYPQPMLRMMGDVDFLVHREDAERAGEALKALGFRETAERDNPIHQAYRRESDALHSSEWELHWQPNGIPYNEVGEKLRALLSDSIETSRLHETENGCFRVPDAFHHGLMLLLHTAMHLIHSGVGLRHLCDWAVFAADFSETEFRALFEAPLRETGLWDFAGTLTALCVRDLGCPDPGWPGERDPELLDALLLDILNGGNFGKKDSQRLNQSKLLVNREKGTVREGSGLRNLLSALNVKARRTLPAAEKHPVLLPAGWLVVGARHLWRVASGRRPSLRLGRMVEGASARSELYSSLHLFEME